MTEDRSTTRQGGFLSRVFAANATDEASVYSRGPAGAQAPEGEHEEGVGRSLTVERAADVIKNLPPEVPRPAAVRIVRGTLEAAGINIAELATSTRARESKLNDEIDLSENRIQEIKDGTEQVIRSLEDEIRQAREARNFGVAEEERKISSAQAGLEDVDRVRDFFSMPEEEAQQSPELPPHGSSPYPEAGEQTEILGRVDDDTQVLRRPGPLSGGWSPDEDAAEGSERGSEGGGARDARENRGF